MGGPVEIGGHLAYRASVGGQEFVVVDGSEGDRYPKVSDVTEIDERLAYVAYEQVAPDEPSGGVGNRECVMYGGEQMGRCYDSVSELTVVDGEPAF